MKVYLAKDWTGVHTFKEPPHLKKCGNLPEIWCGHKLEIFDITSSFAKEEIPRGKYIERNVFWSIVHIIK